MKKLFIALTLLVSVFSTLPASANRGIPECDQKGIPNFFINKVLPGIGPYRNVAVFYPNISWGNVQKVATNKLGRTTVCVVDVTFLSENKRLKSDRRFAYKYMVGWRPGTPETDHDNVEVRYLSYEEWKL